MPGVAPKETLPARRRSRVDSGPSPDTRADGEVAPDAAARRPDANVTWQPVAAHLSTRQRLPLLTAFLLIQINGSPPKSVVRPGALGTGRRLSHDMWARRRDDVP